MAGMACLLRSSNGIAGQVAQFRLIEYQNYVLFWHIRLYEEVRQPFAVSLSLYAIASLHLRKDLLGVFHLSTLGTGKPFADRGDCLHVM